MKPRTIYISQCLWEMPSCLYFLFSLRMLFYGMCLVLCLHSESVSLFSIIKGKGWVSDNVWQYSDIYWECSPSYQFYLVTGNLYVALQIDFFYLWFLPGQSVPHSRIPTNAAARPGTWPCPQPPAWKAACLLQTLCWSAAWVHCASPPPSLLLCSLPAQLIASSLLINTPSPTLYHWLLPFVVPALMMARTVFLSSMLLFNVSSLCFSNCAPLFNSGLNRTLSYCSPFIQ